MKKALVVVIGGNVDAIFIEGEKIDFRTINYDTGTFRKTFTKQLPREHIINLFESSKEKAKEMRYRYRKIK